LGEPGKMGKRVRAMVAEWEGGADKVRAAREALSDAGWLPSDLFGAEGEWKENFATIEAQIASMDGSLMKLKRTMDPDEFTKWQQISLRLLEDLDPALTEYKRRVAEVSGAVRRGFLSQAQAVQLSDMAFKDYIKTLADSEPELSKWQQEVKSALDDIQFAAEGWGRKFEDVIISATQTGKLSFRDMVNSMLADIQRLIIRRAITEPIFGKGGLLSRAAKFIFGPGPTWTAADVAEGIKPLQHGGPVQPMKPYIVGEAGPELFVSSQRGQIIPNKELVGASVSYEQHIHVSPGVQEAVRREINAMRPMLAQDAVRAIRGAKRRGVRGI
jgi:hypothetical protein